MKLITHGTIQEGSRSVIRGKSDIYARLGRPLAHKAAFPVCALGELPRLHVPRLPQVFSLWTVEVTKTKRTWVNRFTLAFLPRIYKKVEKKEAWNGHPFFLQPFSIEPTIASSKALRVHSWAPSTSFVGWASNIGTWEHKAGDLPAIWPKTWHKEGKEGDWGSLLFLGGGRASAGFLRSGASWTAAREGWSGDPLRNKQGNILSIWKWK
jgi:hypothetical protein